MEILEGIGNRKNHIEQDHPEMLNQYDKIKDILNNPFMIARSKTDNEVELFYNKYSRTPVTEKYYGKRNKSMVRPRRRLP